MSPFDANGPGLPGRIFGLPFSVTEATLILVPVPWSPETGYTDVTDLILEASSAIEIRWEDSPGTWKKGMAMLPVNDGIRTESIRIRKLQELESLSGGQVMSQKVNEANTNLSIYIYNLIYNLIKEGKSIGIIGGSEVSGLGAIRALAGTTGNLGILQIDAHAGLRQIWNGMTCCPETIMHQTLQLNSVSKLVQVSTRDFSDEEAAIIQQNPGRISTFTDRYLQSMKIKGENWHDLAQLIVHELPELVYVKIDLDGLDPAHCPGVPFPVPGGLKYEELIYLLGRLSATNRKIIGFEICGSGSSVTDMATTTRILWELSNRTLLTRRVAG